MGLARSKPAEYVSHSDAHVTYAGPPAALAGSMVMICR